MNAVNYDALGAKITKAFAEAGLRPRLLLHSCCAPCSTHCIEALRNSYELTVFYYNPNIFPQAEYEKRASEQRRYIAENMPGIGCEIADYRHSEFSEVVRGYENEREGGARCAECFRLRLRAAAEYAARHGFELYCTTLTVSPYKNAAVINAIGEEEGKRAGVKFLPSDFKKKDGYRDSVARSVAAGLYRQNYCGCEYSLAERASAENGKRAPEGV